MSAEKALTDVTASQAAEPFDKLRAGSAGLILQSMVLTQPV
jgi:hypothetical protein